MAQGYYTLEEAARILGMSVDELKIVARKGEVRSFQDRGTWRFRVQDIQEMGRRRGMGSEPDLPLGDAGAGKPSKPSSLKMPPGQAGTPRASKPSSLKGGPKPEDSPEVFDFSLEIEDDQADVGKGASSKGKPSSKKNLPMTPSPGSDSDVRLVGEDNDFNLEIDSDVKLEGTPKPAPKSPRPGAGGKSSSRGPSSPRPGKSDPTKLPKSEPKRTAMAGPQDLDSGVRLVPLDSDSDVRIVPPEGAEIPLGGQKPPSSTDSDVRLEKHRPGSAADEEGLLTEEINLDEELRKQEAAKGKQPPQAKVRPPAAQLPTTSPFELSEPDVNLGPGASKADSKDDSSSDFELTPAGQSSSPLELGSDEFRLEVPQEDVGLGEAPAQGELKGPSSGINLDNPLDSGISLEQGGEGSDEIEFELTLDDDSSSGNKAGAAPAADSSSEFELTLEPEQSKAPDSDSEFELTLDADDSSPAEGMDSSSDSEFELTLEPSDSSPAEELDSSSDSEFELTLEPSDSSPVAEKQDSDSEFELSLEDSSGNLEVQAGADESDQDIFETDLDAPSLEESGSEAVALDEADTDLESSDFDIALDEGDAEADEESGSQVVALEEDEEDPDAAPSPRGRRGRRAPTLDEEEPGFEGLGGEEGAAAEEEAEEEAETPVLQQAVAAPWGPVPVFFMLPCVIVMFLVGLMGFELVQSMAGYKQPGMITKAISGLVMPK
jgi:hypothetical protein